jgi:DNA polymerase elongation subunit (family B)
MLNQEIFNKLEKIRKSTLVFDIETSAFYPDGREVDIKTNFDDYVSRAKVKWFGCYSYKYNQGYYLNAQQEPNEILKLLSEHDVLVGFNSEEFDFPILANNGFTNIEKRYLQVDCMAILGTSNFKNRKGYAYKGRGALMDYKFTSNSLRCIAETMKLDHLKGDIDWRIFQKDTWTEEEVVEIKKYLYNDVMATKQMYEKLWYYWIPFAELLNEKNIYDLSWIKSSIASLTYKAACRIMNVEPTYSENGRVAEEMGGNVYLPKYEELRGVWYVDVGSLYPHMFTMANLPAEEILPESAASHRKIWHGNAVFQVKGYYDISKWHPLSEYIYTKLKERMYLKEHDKDNPMVYTLKIFLNGLYGIFRSPIFEKIHTPNCGWDCCLLGQQVQALIKEMLEQFGFEVVMGDTDSCFFIAKEGTDNSKEYVQECLTQIADIIKDNLPFPVDTFKIGIEHYLEYLMVPFSDQPIVGEDGKNKKEGNRLIKERKGKKKNYLYIYKDKDETKVKLIGLPLIKDNATPLGMKIYEEILKPEIIKNNRAKFSKSFLEVTINDYLKKSEVMNLVAIEYKVNAFASYKTNCIQAQISQAYLDNQEGIIHLVKNNKIGKVGKGQKYCTIQEAINEKLTIAELDLEKVWNELEPFIEFKEEKFFDVIKKLDKILDDTNTQIEHDPILDLVDRAQEAMVEGCLEKINVIEEPLQEIKKKRGRPKKEVQAVPIQEVTTRKRGRPKKVVTP